VNIDDDSATLQFPPGSCDTHIHFYDHRYQAAPSTVLRPPDASVADYAKVREEFGVSRCVIVQPTTYGLDNRCQLVAARTFGDDARLVVVVDETVTEADLDTLESQGARGVRFHMLPGGTIGWESMAPVSARIADRGWHLQLQLDGRLLPEYLDYLLALPCGLVIDHIGRFMPPVEPDHPAFEALLTLVENGAWVKLSAPYESDAAAAPDFGSASRLARALVAERPERMLWATNWPHPGQPNPPTPNDIATLLYSWVPDAALRHTILVDNPCELYGFNPQPQKEHERGTN
jgi:D-galactarolactone isomerase